MSSFFVSSHHQFESFLMNLNFKLNFVFYRKVHHESEVSMDPLKMDLMRVRLLVSIQKSHLIMPEEPAT